MERIGLRELKNRLGHYVRRARAGHAVEIIDRGAVVAELVPPSSPSAVNAPDALVELARRGLARLGARNDPRLYRRFPALTPPGTAKRLLDQERRER